MLAARRTALAPIRSGLRELAADGLLGHDLAFLCRSYVHMHCNRMFASGAPAVENTVLGLLARTRESLHRAAVAR